MERTIDPAIQQKISLVEALAKGDEVYIHMFSELKRLEQDFLR